MFEKVSSVAIAGMFFSLFVSVLYPVLLLVYWKITQKPKLLPAVIGAITFILFALTLEQILHTVVMTAIGKGDMILGSQKLASNVWIYGLYGGLCAAVFEEIGRFLAMKICMKKSLDKKNAIMYGIGHGGIEAIIILGAAEISNIATSLAINSGSIDTIFSAIPEAQRDTVYEQVAALWRTPATSFYYAGLERITAVTLHICLSYMVYRFVKYNEKKFFLVALGMHFLVDFGTVVMSKALPMIAIEIILAVVVIVFLVCVVKIYKAEEIVEPIMGTDTSASDNGDR